MCIGVPGLVLAVGEDIHQLAQVEVCGIKRDVNIALICEGNPADLLGQWVLVHVGFAMSIIDEDEAKSHIRRTAPNGLRHYQRVMISFCRPDKDAAASHQGIVLDCPDAA